MAMRLAPFRAVLLAHLQISWNRSVREMGRQGALGTAVLVAVLGLLVLGPLFLGLGSLGWFLGRDLDQPISTLLLSGILTFLSLGGGLYGGVAGGAQKLNWEAYRGYPLPSTTLYLAELLAGIADPLPSILAIGLLGLLCGLGLSSPATLPLLPLVLVETLATLLALQLLVGSLAGALVKRLRLALTVLAALAWVGSTLATAPTLGSLRPRASVRSVPLSPKQLSPEQRGPIAALAHRGAQALAVLPSQNLVQSLVGIHQGHWARALSLHLYPLTTLALLMVLGAQLMLREARTERRPASSQRPERLWSFRGPAEGVGRLHLRTLLGSLLGKFSFVMPLMTLVLIKGPFAHLRAQSLWAVPAAFAYLSLVGNNFVLNQFGLDRHGVKALLLLPISSQDLLRGKLLGLAMQQALQTLLLILLLAVFEGASPTQLVAGTLMIGGIFLAQVAVGQWSSAWAPRPMAMNSLKNNAMPFTVVMLSLATSGLWVGLFGGAYALTAWLAPAWLIPVMAPGFLLALAAHFALLPAAAAYLDRRRDVLVERLG